MEVENQDLKLDPKKLKPHPINLQLYGEEGIDFRLVDSIKEKGQLEPVVVIEDKEVAGDYVIISGHRRWTALKHLENEVNCRLVSFEDNEDELEIKQSIVEYNKYRKKKPSQIVNEANLLRSIIAEKAKKRQEATLKQNADMPDSAQREEMKKEAGTTRDKVADAVCIGRDKLEKLTKIKEKADAGDEHAKILMAKLDNEELTANAAHTYLELIEVAKSEDQDNDYAMELLDQIHKEKITPNKANELLNKKKKDREIAAQKKDSIPRNHEGDYSVLFADFSNSHPPLEDYMHLAIPSTDSSVLCLLTATAFLKESIDVMDWWGFEYKSMCIWDRDTKASNSWFKESHELLLLGTKGDVHAPALEDRFPSIIHEKKGNECVHEMIKKMFPGQKYIDLFPKADHEGWDNWVLEEKKEIKKIESKLDQLFDDYDKNETIKMIMLGKKKQDDTQDAFEDLY